MQGAYWTGQYPSRLETLGYAREEITKKLEHTFDLLFHGSEDMRICHPAGADMLYTEDTGNHDVRTEGMS